MHSQSEPAAIAHLWGLTHPVTKGPKARVTLDEVVRASVALADEGSFEAVTLSAVAAMVGLTTTALYRYVDSKDTLMELMVDAALGAPPSHGMTLVQAVDQLWLRYQAHPWLATFPLTRAPRCPHGFGWLEVLMVAANQAGSQDALGAAMAIDVLLKGYAAIDTLSRNASVSPPLMQEMVRRYPQLFATTPRGRTPKEELDAVIAKLAQPPASVSPSA